MRQPRDRAVVLLTLRAIALVWVAQACAACNRTREHRDAWQADHADREPSATVLALHAGVARAAIADADAGAHGDAGTTSANTPDAATLPTATPAGFLGESDETLLRRVCDAAVARIERNRGGSTLSFRTWFEGGGRGLFKPQQRAEVANFRAELAAYRLARLLGVTRVPPACGRRMDRARLQQVADASGDAAYSERVMHEMFARDDHVPGAMLYWVPGPLENVPGTDRWTVLLDLAQPLANVDVDLATDLSRLIVFDFVTDNVDRWSGGNILRQHLVDRAPGPMLYMDNGASFSAGTDGLGARPREQADRLAHVQRASRSLLAALRALDPASIAGAMRGDPIAPLLTEQQIHALLVRRDRVVTHFEALVREHGDGAVMAFP